MKPQHMCSLPVKDTTGLHKLPPNATCFQKFRRELRKFLLLNPRHYKCKKLFRNKSTVMQERRKHAIGPYSSVIHPLSSLNLIIELLFFVTWMATLLSRPLNVFSDKFVGVYRIIQNKVLAPIQLVLILLHFNVGYVEKKTGLIILKPKKIILRYASTFFIFDVAACFLILTTRVLTEKGYVKCMRFHVNESYCFEMVTLLGLGSSCLRINTLLRYMNELLANMGARKVARSIVIYMVKTLLYLHLFTFVLYYVPYVLYEGNWKKQSWLYQAKISHQDPLHRQYFETFLMAICYFFGIAYRFDIDLVEEQVCVSIVSFIGRLYTLYMLADILNIFGIVGVSESMYERQLSLLQQYMVATDVPLELRRRMLMYYEFKFQRRFFRENVIVNTLSEHLRTELFLYSARRMIQKVEFFKKLPTPVTGAMVAVMRSEIYSPRDVIIKIGSKEQDVFFISSGTVCFITKSGIELCHLDDGDNFGTSAFIYKEHLFTVMAVETTEVFLITKSQLLEFLSPYPDILNSFYYSVKKRVTKLKELEAKLSSDSIDLIHDLRSGKILEERSKRLLEK